jgi:hypothetical protein
LSRSGERPRSCHHVREPSLKFASDSIYLFLNESLPATDSADLIDEGLACRLARALRHEKSLPIELRSRHLLLRESKENAPREIEPSVAVSREGAKG